MPTLTPYQGLSVDRLAALINSDNNTSYKLGKDFTLGAPSAVTTDTGRNAQVTLTPTSGSGIARPQRLTYTRLGIDAIGRLPTNSVDAVPVDKLPTTTTGLLDAINTALGLDLLPAEVEDLTYSTLLDTFALTIADGSYAWTPGSTYHFSVAVAQAPDLSTSLSNANLGLFSYSRPALP